MGNHVTDTIRKGIADYECFEYDPELLAYGCMWVIAAVAGWLFTASYFEIPVSTSHSCVGGMIGMTIALKGANCIIWTKSVFKFIFQIMFLKYLLLHLNYHPIKDYILPNP